MELRSFTNDDYELLCDFFIELDRQDRSHINWNWARFEWMYEHPYFDKSLESSIGIWLDEEKIVAAAVYDMYFGEAFCGALKEYEYLYPEVLDYAFKELKDDSGLGVAICDNNQYEIAAAKNAGFKKAEQTETMMSLSLDREFPSMLPTGFSFSNPDPVKDAYEIQWLFWQGFDHGTDKAEFEKEEQIVPQVRRHFNRDLGVAAVTPEGELAALCCLWYSDKTDYAYVEPVCTVPSCRGKGLAKAVIYEALNRAKMLGAKKAYVLSDMEFYEKLGFKKLYGYTFYRKTN